MVRLNEVVLVGSMALQRERLAELLRPTAIGCDVSVWLIAFGVHSLIVCLAGTAVCTQPRHIYCIETEYYDAPSLTPPSSCHVMFATQNLVRGDFTNPNRGNVSFVCHREALTNGTELVKSRLDEGHLFVPWISFSDVWRFFVQSVNTLDLTK
jgi:hypothetical protein